MESTLGLLAFLLAAGLLLEGLNIVTGGEVYLESTRQLAQAAGSIETQGTTVQPVLAPAPTSETTPASAPSPQTDSQSAQQLQPQIQPPPPPPTGKERPAREGLDNGHEDNQQDFVDQREIQQVLREIRDLKSQIRQIANRVRKNASFADEAARLTAISSELDQAQSAIKNASSQGGFLREVIQDFRDAQYWDEIDKIRAKVELPREIKQIEQILRRLERTLKIKAVQNLGLNIETLQARAGEMKEQIAAVQGHVAAGNLEEAMEAMRSFHEGGHPGEIEGTIYRIRDIKQMLRRVKDEQIRAEVDRTLQEVVDAFNQGEYRDARETLDEYADDLQRLIQRFLSTKTFRGKNRQDSFSRIQNLDALIRSKLQEPDERGPQQKQ